MVCITSNTAFLARPTQVESSMARVMRLLMNPYIGDYFALPSTDSVSACTSDSEVGRSSSLGSNFL